MQALIVEVQLGNTKEAGVELGFQDSVLFDRSIIDSIQTINQTALRLTVCKQLTKLSCRGFPLQALHSMVRNWVTMRSMHPRLASKVYRTLAWVARMAHLAMVD